MNIFVLAFLSISNFVDFNSTQMHCNIKWKLWNSTLENVRLNRPQPLTVDYLLVSMAMGIQRHLLLLHRPIRQHRLADQCCLILMNSMDYVFVALFLVRGHCHQRQCQPIDHPKLQTSYEKKTQKMIFFVGNKASSNKIIISAKSMWNYVCIQYNNNNRTENKVNELLKRNNIYTRSYQLKWTFRCCCCCLWETLRFRVIFQNIYFRQIMLHSRTNDVRLLIVQLEVVAR